MLFGVIALIAMYALVRAARAGVHGSRSARRGVMSLDNLMLVHSRIGTLDIYYVAMALVAAALYVRNRPLLGGIALGIGACMKLSALGALPAFVLLEAFVVAWARGAKPGEPGVWRTARARLKPLAVMIGGERGHPDPRRVADGRARPGL